MSYDGMVSYEHAMVYVMANAKNVPEAIQKFYDEFQAGNIRGYIIDGNHYMNIAQIKKVFG